MENKYDYRTQRDLYREEQKRLDECFKQKLLEDYKVKDNPKADMAYNLAWDYGHSCGYGEVENYFSEFVRLIKD